MKRCLKWHLLVSVVLWGIIACAQSTAPCNYTTFQYPGAVHTTPTGINRWGTIVGFSELTTGGVQFGFVRYSGGGYQKFLVPGSETTQLRRRNDKGLTVGYYSVAGYSHGLLLNGNSYQTIDYPGATDTVLMGINNWDSIVGYYADSSGHYIGFKRWANGTFTRIQYPNASDTQPSDINDAGVIVGTVGAGGPGDIFGFVLANGKYQRVDDPYANPDSTMLNDLNRGGTIVGTGFTSGGGGPLPQGFRIINGTAQNLVPTGADISEANGINLDGVIVGDADFSGTEKGYIASCK